MSIPVPIRKHCRNVLYKSNKKIFTTVNSHVNSSKSNYLNTSNSDNLIGTSNLPRVKL